uniref:Uncharacterized LOC114644859 n=2 Tax=Erpetoichthys calabaricus TaxID=27687 RepID=A0A8C4T7V7_ERPCA
MDSAVISLMLLLSTLWISGDCGVSLIENIKGHCLTDSLQIQIDKAFLHVYSVTLFVRDDAGESHLLDVSLNAKCGYKLRKNYRGDLDLFASLKACHVYNEENHVFLTLEVMFTPLNSSMVAEMEVFSFSCTQKMEPSVKRKITCEEDYIEVSLIVDPAFQFALYNAAKDDLDPWYFEVHYPDDGTINVDYGWILDNGIGLNISAFNGWITFRVPVSHPIIQKKDLTNRQFLRYKVAAKHEDLLIGLRYDLSALCPKVYIQCRNGRIAMTAANVKFPVRGETSDLIIGMMKDGTIMSQQEMEDNHIHLYLDAHKLGVTYPQSFNMGYDVNGQFLYMHQLHLVHTWRDLDERGDVSMLIKLPGERCLEKSLKSTKPEFVVKSKYGGFDITYGPVPIDYVLARISIDGVTSYSVKEIKDLGVNVTIHKEQKTQYVHIWVQFGDSLVPHMLVGKSTLLYSVAPSVVFKTAKRPDITVTSKAYAHRRSIVLPTLKGSCTEKSICFNVTRGTVDHLWTFYVWKYPMVPSPSEERGYVYKDYFTHYTMCVGIESLYLLHRNLTENARWMALSVSFHDERMGQIVVAAEHICSFPSSGELECTVEGEMKATSLRTAMSADSDLTLLTLKDPFCGPSDVRGSLASFNFPISSCSTTKELKGDLIIYRNEISYGDEHNFTHKIFMLGLQCQYLRTNLLSLDFKNKHTRSQPRPAPGQGDLKLSMNIMKDSTFLQEYQENEFPITKFLKEPLYVEVYVHSSDSGLELFLKDCWGTPGPDPSNAILWPIIKDSCEFKQDKYKMEFHPVRPNSRVKFPKHYKRFEVKMFSFAEAETKKLLDNQIYFHCLVIVCDSKVLNLDRRCSGVCIPAKQRKGRGASFGVQQAMVSSYGIHLQIEDVFTHFSNAEKHLWLVVSTVALFSSLSFIVYVYWRMKLKNEDNKTSVS